MQDVKILKRRRWHYLILDEAHMIKNWKSQRWQALLNFSARHRLLITGAPRPPRHVRLCVVTCGYVLCQQCWAVGPDFMELFVLARG